MHVDGGKTLTSKGQQDWYGSAVMNRKYEQDSLAYYTKMFAAATPERAKPRNLDDLEEWVQARGESSVWAKKDEELHIKVTAEYTK